MQKNLGFNGNYMATLPEQEQTMFAQVQDKLRAQRSLGQGPDRTIELPMQWCEEAIALVRQGKVSRHGVMCALEWALRNPDEVQSIVAVVDAQGLRLQVQSSNPTDELNKLVAHHQAWRTTYASDPLKAIREATRAIMASSRGLCNPLDTKEALNIFFMTPLSK